MKTAAIIETGMTSAIMLENHDDKDKDGDGTHHNDSYKPFNIPHYK